MNKKIPFLDLKQQNNSVKDEIFNEFEKVFESTAFSGGPFVEEFEKDFSLFTNSQFTVAVSNGTTALHLSLLACGVGRGDEVILPANTFISTAWAISYVGATPIFVDCNKDTWEIDAKLINEKLNSKTKAIMGVHLYGQPFDYDSVNEIAKNKDLYLIQDAAQAHGAKYKKNKIGSFGLMSCFSFYPGKNLGACGEGGGITTNDESIRNKLQSLRNHGSTKKYYHDEIGYNYRMGGLEAASLKVKLKYLESWNQRRVEIAKKYFERINNSKIVFQKQPEWSDSVFHLFVVMVERRQEFIEYLERNNILPGLHYPVPCHLQKSYKFLEHKEGDFPNSELLAKNCVSLPIFNELSFEEVDYIIDVVNKY